jgi:hypothetical protein
MIWSLGNARSEDKSLMQAEIQFGNQKLRLNPAPGVIIPTQGEAPTAPLIDAGGAVAAALEEPLGFPALRLALTPDDRVAVVVDDALPELGAMLNALLDHLLKAHIRPEDDARSNSISASSGFGPGANNRPRPHRPPADQLPGNDTPWQAYLLEPDGG